MGEALEGASLVPPATTGVLLDFGSGNGYPGLPLAAARPGLRPVLADASVKRAAFLRSVLAAIELPGAEVLERQIQRAADLSDLPPIRVITARAVGGWTRVLPKLAPRLEPGGVILVWAGIDVDVVRRRQVWRRLELFAKKPLPGREQSAIWAFQ